MTANIKKFIVWGTERLCNMLDYLPYIFHYRSCYFARISANLDEKWRTGIWKEPHDDQASV